MADTAKLMIKTKPDQAASQTTPLARLAAFYNQHENTILGVGTLVAFLGIWELVSRLGWIKPIFISSPTGMVKAAGWLFSHGFWHDVQVSATELGIGLLFSVVVGIPVGILLGWSRRLNAMFDPLVSALYATPRVALLPLLILWLGLGTQSITAVVFLGAIFPMIVNAAAGVKTIDERLLTCARSFGANPYQILTTLALPTSVPFLIAGMRLAVGRALVGVVVGELIGSRAGIGHMMSLASASFQTDKYFVGVVFLAVCGYLISVGLKRLEAHFESWRPR
jgi:NitT/TauT family transport system permease protein